MVAQVALSLRSFGAAALLFRPQPGEICSPSIPATALMVC